MVQYETETTVTEFHYHAKISDNGILFEVSSSSRFELDRIIEDTLTKYVTDNPQFRNCIFHRRIEQTVHTINHESVKLQDANI